MLCTKKLFEKIERMSNQLPIALPHIHSNAEIDAYEIGANNGEIYLAQTLWFFITKDHFEQPAGLIKFTTEFNPDDVDLYLKYNARVNFNIKIPGGLEFNTTAKIQDVADYWRLEDRSIENATDVDILTSFFNANRDAKLFAITKEKK
jgi:hypothetical protein